ncbi:MAG TPA: LysE family transporter [Candidatus Thermoplasmatota archaeon]|nr:LysE family transporter [Candidatus Thermoplasmatota archaeon]
MAEPAYAILLGAGLGLSLAAPPGPVLAFSMRRAAEHGFWPGVFVPFGAICADATHAAFVGVGVVPLLVAHPWAMKALAAAGAALMVYLAVGAFRAARTGPPDPSRPVVAARPWSRRLTSLGLLGGGFAAGYALAITSPMNLAWWVSVGTHLFAEHGIAVFAGFFGALVAYSFAFTGAVVLATQKAARAIPIFAAASGVVFVAFAAYLVWTLFT